MVAPAFGRVVDQGAQSGAVGVPLDVVGAVAEGDAAVGVGDEARGVEEGGLVAQVAETLPVVTGGDVEVALDGLKLFAVVEVEGEHGVALQLPAAVLGAGAGCAHVEQGAVAPCAHRVGLGEVAVVVL